MQSAAARQAALKALLRQAAQTKQPASPPKRTGPLLAPKAPPPAPPASKASPPALRAQPRTAAGPAPPVPEGSSKGRVAELAGRMGAVRSPEREQSVASVASSEGLAKKAPLPSQQPRWGRQAAGVAAVAMAATAEGAAPVDQTQPTATQLQRSALPPFSSRLMAKNMERQRAAAARGSHGPLPIQGPLLILIFQ